MKKLCIIAAVDKHYAIGKGGKIPWHIPEDYARFKQLTMGKPIIMGRKTFDSIGRLLPGRKNIVLTRNVLAAFNDWQEKHPQVSTTALNSLTYCESFDEALDEAYKHHSEPWVIGGGDIYTLAAPLCTRIELTLVDIVVEDADAFFPYEAFGQAWGSPMPAPEHVLARMPCKEHNGLMYSFINSNKPERVPAAADMPANTNAPALGALPTPVPEES